MSDEMEPKAYRKVKMVMAMQLTLGLRGAGMRYNKWGGVQTAHADDWLVTGPDGDQYTVTAEEFAKTYVAVPGKMAVYRKMAVTYAVELTEDGTINTLEGVSEYSAGDYMCSSNADMMDAYPVTRETFEDLYVPADAELPAEPSQPLGLRVERDGDELRILSDLADDVDWIKHMGTLQRSGWGHESAIDAVATFNIAAAGVEPHNTAQLLGVFYPRGDELVLGLELLTDEARTWFHQAVARSLEVDVVTREMVVDELDDDAEEVEGLPLRVTYVIGAAADVTPSE